eukprot:SAG31_NODE_1694_length_7509_cov_14.080432_2_plen_312_part_00
MQLQLQLINELLFTTLVVGLKKELYNLKQTHRRHAQTAKKRIADADAAAAAASENATKVRQELDSLRQECQAQDLALATLADIAKMEAKARLAAEEEAGEAMALAAMDTADTVIRLYREGKFTTRARIIGYTLLRHGVSTKTLGACIQDLAPLFDARLAADGGGRQTFSETTARRLQVERGEIGKQIVGRHIIMADAGTVAIMADAGTVKTSHALAVGVQLPGADGRGDRVRQLPLGLEPIKSGMAVDEAAAVERQHQKLSNSMNKLAEECRARGLECDEAMTTSLHGCMGTSLDLVKHVQRLRYGLQLRQ